MEQIYIQWIDNGLDSAIESFRNLLTSKNIDENNTYSITNKVMYRCRKSDSHLSHWDMFHIPFNKRYLINNQRYSLVGRPMLYLASTPKCALKELGMDALEHNCYISSFLLKKGENLKIFDLRNGFSEQIIQNEMDIMIDYQKTLSKKQITGDFFKLIVSSVCSFTKRSSTSKYFSEEYVLPQILAEIISKTYDGLVYSSTKFEDEDDKKKRGNDFKSNIVIFTKYDKAKIADYSYVYDKDLYQKFLISAPIELGTIEEGNILISRDEFVELLGKYNMDNSNCYDIRNMTSDILDMDDAAKDEYFRDEMGNLHVLLLYNLINMFKNQCNNGMEG